MLCMILASTAHKMINLMLPKKCDQKNSNEYKAALGGCCDSRVLRNLQYSLSPVKVLPVGLDL